MDKTNTRFLGSEKLFNAFGILLTGTIFLSLYLENPLPLLLPILALVSYSGALNLNRLYAFFFVLLPFSIELDLPGGLGTDLPAEPFMLGLTLTALLLFLKKYNSIPAKFIKHPYTIMLLVHIVWIGIATFFSQDFIISFKFFLAKLWYVIPFYFLAIYLLRKQEDFVWLLNGMIGSLSLAVLFVLYSHAQTGFSFDTINQAVSPVFRNHVNYACLLTLIMPYCWYLYKISIKKSSKLIYIVIISFFLLAIYFSYTRAAYVALAIAIAVSIIVKLRLTKLAVFFSLMIAFASVIFLLVDNNYLDYKPEYEKAITHKKFDNLIEATSKLEDISTVERFYRWIAGGHMISDRPALGFGPGTFYFFYQSYTVTGFQTYVSDNPEKSGIHNYYLMTAVEQGLPGFIIFLVFCIVVILKGEQIYHKTVDRQRKYLVMASLLSFVIICAILLINDMVEAAKVGPFFFLAPALLLICDLIPSSKE